MSQKKRSGLFPLLFGAVLGAAAVVFSNKENRDKAKKVASDAATDVKKFKKEYDQDKKKAVKKVQKKAENILDKAVNRVKEVAKKVHEDCESGKKEA